MDDIPLTYDRYKPRCMGSTDIMTSQRIPRMVVTTTDMSVMIKTSNGLDVDNLLESIPAQSCLSMDFPKENVKLAICVYIQRKCDFSFKAKDLCEILFEIEEKPEIFNTSLTPLKDSTTVAAQNGDNCKKDDLNISLKKHSKHQQMHDCQICMQEEETMILMAYGHWLSCKFCSLGLYNVHSC